MIFDGSDIIVVGGDNRNIDPGSHGLMKTEKCTIAEGQMNCVEQDPELENYENYPEIFLVEEGFCKEWPSV